MVCALALSLMAQTPDRPAQTQTPAAPQPSARQMFPFPEDDSKTAVPDAPSAVPEAPGAAVPAAKDAAKKYPFPTDAPGSSGDNPAQPNTPPTTPGSGYSSSKDNVPAAEPAESNHKLQLSDAGSEGLVDTARAEKDMQVADYYIKDGNYAGAYLRYKDAVTFAPDDAEAHFRLAEMARKQGKKTEAASEYAACLKLDEQGKRAKEARKALEELKSPGVPAMAPVGPK
jgi:tetratricopeptide (TPR) repeat protein